MMCWQSYSNRQICVSRSIPGEEPMDRSRKRSLSDRIQLVIPKRGPKPTWVKWSAWGQTEPGWILLVQGSCPHSANPLCSLPGCCNSTQHVEAVVIAVGTQSTNSIYGIMEILCTWTQLVLALPFKNCVRLGMALPGEQLLIEKWQT